MLRPQDGATKKAATGEPVGGSPRTGERNRMTTALNILHGAFGRVALLDMDQSLVPHAHHHCHVLLKGSGADQDFIVRGETCPLENDTAVLVNSWAEHAYRHRPGEDRTLILALYIEPGWLSDLDLALTSSVHPTFFSQPCVRITPEVRRLAGQMADILNLGVELGPDEAETMIFDLMIAVIDRFSNWRAFRGVRTLPGRVTDYRIRRAIAAMRASPIEAVDINKLAEIAGLSRPRFFQLFKQSTGITPFMYANVLRVEQAVRALSTTGNPIIDISMDLGFDAQSNFTRFFRQNVGVTPREYRKTVSVLAHG